MHAEIYQGPLDLLPTAMVQLHEPIKVSDLLVMPGIECPVELHEFIVVKVGGIVVERAWWQYVTIKPDSGHKIEICTVYQRGALTTILAVVAVAAAVAIGTFGIPFLGIAAGSLWANVIAAGIGIAAQLAIRALTAAPLSDNVGQGAQKIVAGISSNTPVLNDALPVIFGKIGISPPHLCPPYTTFDNLSTTVVAVMGFQGPCQINKLLINGLPEDQIPGLLIEKREGWASDAPRTIGLDTVIEQRSGVVLSQFNSLQTTYGADPIVNQPPLATDIPQWHPLKTDGVADDFSVRFLAQSGFTDSNTANNLVMCPVRIRIRLKGTTAWRNIPEIHLQDLNKGSKPTRWEAKFKFGKLPGGVLVGQDLTKSVWDVINIAGYGTAYEYRADPYFIGSTPAGYQAGTPAGFWINNFIATGPTTSGMTVSASSTNGSNAPWKAFDGNLNGATYWESALTGVPQWLRVDFSAPQTIKSYYFLATNGTTVDARTPAKFWFQGSNDGGTTWINLDDVEVDLTNSVRLATYGNVQNPGSYSSYRWYFDATYGGATSVVLCYMDLFSAPAGTSIKDSPNGGLYTYHTSNLNLNRSQNLNIGATGVTFYLDPAQWPQGIYEVQMMRGLALPTNDFTPASYAMGHASSLFDAVLASGQYVAGYSVNYHSDLQIEVFQTHQAVPPFDPRGICMVAISVPSLQVNSIYIEATRYAPDFDGQVWTERWIPQKNPAALYRQVLLGGGNAMPVFDEIIDEAELQAWFQTCKTNDYQCNAVLSGARVAEALQMIGSAGYAAPRTSNFYGVVEDKDVSALPVSYAITPLNSKDQGTKAEAQNLPHAIHAVFADETDSYAQNQIDVYRSGYDVTNSKLFESVVYTGHTAVAKVQKRAAFDMNQLFLRPRKYVREVGIEGFLMRRGDLVAINDDVLSGNHAAGWISSVQVSGGNVVSVTLENIIPWSRSAAFEATPDVSTLTDILNTSAQMAVAIRVPGQAMVIRTVSEIVDKSTCTFVTPFPDDGTIKPDQMVIAGTFKDTHRRVKIFEIQPKGYESFTITMVDEAPALFA